MSDRIPVHAALVVRRSVPAGKGAAGQAGRKRLGERRGGAFGTRRRGHEVSLGIAGELV